MQDAAACTDEHSLAPRFAPHLLLFGFYNVLYFVPLFLLFLWDYTSSQTASSLAIDARTALAICAVYLSGTVGFFLGTLPLKLLGSRDRGGAGRRWHTLLPPVRLADKLVILLLVIVFLISKVALIPLGVYHEYAFSSGEMTGGLWSFSTFCSETMVLFGIVVLFSGIRRNVLTFLVIAALNGINLLHGTRIFFIVTVLSGVLYACLRGHITLRRALVYGPLAALAVVTLAYVVSLSRNGLSVQEAFSAASLLRPVIDESLLSQLSLVSLLRSPAMWDATGHPLELLADIIVNTTPRILLPDKDDLVYFAQFSYLSPLGGINGYADGLIYFGLFFPFCYFVLGFVASWLYGKAQTGRWWLILYVYFTADFLFRIMRDGYVIPMKMLLNTLEWVAVFMMARALIRAIARKRSMQGPAQGGAAMSLGKGL